MRSETLARRGGIGEELGAHERQQINRPPASAVDWTGSARSTYAWPLTRRGRMSPSLARSAGPIRSRTARCRGWRARSAKQQLVTTIAPAAIHARMHHRHAGERFERGPRWPLPRGGRGRPSRGRGAAARNVRRPRSYPRVGVWSFTPGTPRAADNAGIQQTHLGLATCPF